MRELDVLLATGLAIVAMIATVMLKHNSKGNCLPGSDTCTISLGLAGRVDLPAVVTFKTVHSTYLSSHPPSGGSLILSAHSRQWEWWEIIQETDDLFSLRSYHGTYIRCNQDPAKGFDLVSYPNTHELFNIELVNSTRYAIMGHNGHFLSAHLNGQVKQARQRDAWELFELENRVKGWVALKSVHGTYLGATEALEGGSVLQASRMDTWETFVLDRGKRQGQFTLETSHGMFLTAGENSLKASKNLPEEWEIVVSRGGKVCLKTVHGGDFAWALEDRKGIVLMPLCIDHAMLTPAVVDPGMWLNATEPPEHPSAGDTVDGGRQDPHHRASNGKPTVQGKNPLSYPLHSPPDDQDPDQHGAFSASDESELSDDSESGIPPVATEL